MSGTAPGISRGSEVDSAAPRDAAPPGASINRLLTDKPVGVYTRAKFTLVRFFLDTWVRFFGLTGLYWFGSVFANVEFLLNRGRRRRYRKELLRLFPNGISRARELKIIRRYFRRTRCDKLFYLIYDKLPRNKVLSRIRLHGRDHLDRGIAGGRGVYLAMSHHGSHHILGMVLSLLGYRITGIRDRNEGTLRTYIQQTAAKGVPEFRAVQMLYADDFPREIFRCFRENRVVVSALDVNRVRGRQLKTCEVEIFGQRREFLTGTMQIALRCDAAIVPAFLLSRANFYYRLVILPPLHDPAAVTDGNVPKLPELMQQYASAIEHHVRRHPDHLSRV